MSVFWKKSFNIINWIPVKAIAIIIIDSQNLKKFIIYKY